MFAVPIAAREAREISRRPGPYHARWVIGLLGLLAIIFALWLSQRGATQGDAVFLFLAVLAQAYTLFAGVIVAADTIASERREGTLGFLFLTDLRPRHILLGKLLASSTTAIFGLLTFLPLLAIPLLMGGVSFERYLLLAAHLANTLFLSISWGFVVSTIFKRGWAAITAGIVVMAVLGIGFPLTAIWWSDAVSPYAPLTPFTGLYILWDEPLADLDTLYLCLLTTHASAWANLLFVSLRLRRLWRDQPDSPFQLVGAEAVETVRFGTKRARRRLRATLLDQNPLSWLANREQISSLGLIAAIFGAFASMNLLLYVAEENRFANLGIVCASVIGLAHLALIFRICIAAANPLNEDRKSGALELLLSTPISVREIIHGRWLGLMRQFFGPALIIQSAHLIFFLIAFFVIDFKAHENLFANLLTLQINEQQTLFYAVAFSFFLLPLHWIAAAWLGMWFGLRFRSSATAVWLTITIVLLAPWLLFGILFILLQFAGLQRIVEEEQILAGTILLGCIFGLTQTGLTMHFARWRLVRIFRFAAADHFRTYRLPFPWAVVRKFAVIGAALFAFLLGSAWIWRKQTNYRAEKAWQAALAQHPEFPLEAPYIHPPAPIPPEKNLAECRLLKPMNEQTRRVIQANRTPTNPPIFSLRNPLTAMPNWNSGPWIPPQQHMNLWARGKLLPLDEYESYFLKRRVVTNRAGSPARTILASYSQMEPLIEELYASARERPETRFDRDHAHLATVANALLIHAVARLRIDQPASEDVLLLLRLAKGVQHISHDPSYLTSQAIQPIYEGLAQHRWNETELLALQKAVAALNCWDRLRTVIDATTRARIRDIDDTVVQGKKFQTPLQRLFWSAYPKGYLFEAKEDIFRGRTEDFAAALDFQSRRVFPARALMLPILQSRHPLLTGGDYGSHLLGWIRSVVYLQTTLDQIQIACALERHRLKHGVLPNCLTDLSPAFIDPLPNDILTGEPMIFAVSADRQKYRLSSVAWDGREDGGQVDGNAALNAARRQKTDWVWKIGMD